ncbi:MAG: site-2 protease family protein [Acidobacteria bacterium]|nr:site-2 protease family protein [Acidobacteriota bacterium]
MRDISIGYIIIWFVIFLLSLTVHECAHALAAELSGDSTGRYMGRISLSPIPHIDPLGTIVLPLMMMFYGGWMFGWAKPVPFNPMQLRNRKLGEIFIAVAGPLSNVLLAILFFVLLKTFFYSDFARPQIFGDLATPVFTMLGIGLQLNIILAVFNMIPIPPLDGHHVLRNLLPDTLAESFAQASPMIGLVGMVLLLATGITGYLVSPVINVVESMLNW